LITIQVMHLHGNVLKMDQVMHLHGDALKMEGPKHIARALVARNQINDVGAWACAQPDQRRRRVGARDRRGAQGAMIVDLVKSQPVQDLAMAALLYRPPADPARADEHVVRAADAICMGLAKMHRFVTSHIAQDVRDATSDMSQLYDATGYASWRDKAREIFTSNAETRLAAISAGIGSDQTDEKIAKAQASIAVSSKKRSANGAPKPTSRNTVVDTTTGKVSNSSDDQVYETNETFSVLGKQAWQLGHDEKGRVELLEAWLRRKLHEEVQTQAFHVSRGLREVIP